MAFRVQIRRDPSGKWIVNNPILLSGEFGYETDTAFMKIGDGATPWNYLPYWNTGQGGGPTGPSASLYSLPSPKVLIIAGGPNIVTLSTLNTVDGGTGPDFILVNHPEISPMNITQEQIDAGVWVEMVYNSRMRGKRSSSGTMVQSKGFKAFNSCVAGDNTLVNDIIAMNPNTTPVFNTRGGVSNQQNIEKFNHFKVQSLNTRINVSQYFYGLFTYANVIYNDVGEEGSTVGFECLIPSLRFTTKTIDNQFFGKRFYYSNAYGPLYVKFRYIMWNPEANSGKGDFVTGPLSETVKLAQSVQPFIVDFERSQIEGISYGNINPYYYGDQKTSVKCWIQDNTP